MIIFNYSIDVIREIGVETGGANVQFAVNPKTGRMVVIEMNAAPGIQAPPTSREHEALSSFACDLFKPSVALALIVEDFIEVDAS